MNIKDEKRVPKFYRAAAATIAALGCVPLAGVAVVMLADVVSGRGTEQGRAVLVAGAVVVLAAAVAVALIVLVVGKLLTMGPDPIPTPVFAPTSGGTHSAPSPATVIWAEVPFEAGIDELGRTSKDRPVLVVEVLDTPTGPVVSGFPITSKVDKYEGRPGYVVVTGDWAGPESRSCVDTTRRVHIRLGDIRRSCGRIRNTADVVVAAGVRFSR